MQHAYAEVRLELGRLTALCILALPYTSCGGSSGMFLLIRRCAVILLYANNGCTASSPYLDIHGEVDMGNRRHRRQFLQVKRYEELRRIWIQQSIPTAVARRLEAGVDNGGW